MLLAWRHRKNASKEPARLQMSRSYRAIIRNVPAHFKPRSNLLRMIAFNTTAGWKVGRAAKHQIKSFILTQIPPLPKIAVPDLETIFQPIPFGRFSREPHALFLRLHRNEPRSDQSPRRNH